MRDFEFIDVADIIIRRKLVVTGDEASSNHLLHRFVKGEHPAAYVPTVFENHVANVEAAGELVELALWTTAGQESYDRLRSLTYPDSNVVLICFAIDSPDLLASVRDKWVSEVRNFCAVVPIILVGCKKDSRDNTKTIQKLRKVGQRPVTFEEGVTVAREIGAHRYLECSAKSGEGVYEVFQYAARTALVCPCGPMKRRESGCIIL